MAMSALVLKNSVCGPGCGRRTICGSSGEAEVSFEIVASIVGLVSVGGGISSSHVVTGNFVTGREVDDGGWGVVRGGWGGGVGPGGGHARPCLRGAASDGGCG